MKKDHKIKRGRKQAQLLCQVLFWCFFSICCSLNFNIWHSSHQSSATSSQLTIERDHSARYFFGVFSQFVLIKM
jgi:hypothetical protein